MTIKFRMARALVLALASAFIVIGCMYAPQNGQELTSTTERISIAGYHDQPGKTIKVSVLNSQTDQWELLQNFTSSNVVNRDDVGNDWYWWGTVRSLPQDRKYWAGASGRRLAVKLRAEAFNTSTPLPLYTFDRATAEACGQANRSGGGYQIINKCRSSASPVVTVYAPCGQVDQACCNTWPTCDTGLACTEDYLCRPCGAQGQSCCIDRVCNSGLVCQSNFTCAAPCGASGQACCANNSCNSGLTCQSGRCATPPPPCGDLNQACCGSFRTCNTASSDQMHALQCATRIGGSAVCTICGERGSPCCVDVNGNNGACPRSGSCSGGTCW